MPWVEAAFSLALFGVPNYFSDLIWILDALFLVGAIKTWVMGFCLLALFGSKDSSPSLHSADISYNSNYPTPDDPQERPK